MSTTLPNLAEYRWTIDDNGQSNTSNIGWCDMNWVSQSHTGHCKHKNALLNCSNLTMFTAGNSACKVLIYTQANNQESVCTVFS